MNSFTLKDGTLLRGNSLRIIRFLSAGGFGCTYEAVHTGLKRRVAIKEFFVSDFCNRDPETARVYVSTQSKVKLAEKLKRKFLDEASAVANLNHPGIVRVTDVFEENGTAYFVMDFIDGRGLDQLIADKGYLPENEALRYIRQAANALAYVHGTKRLHLDIKPGNIMIDRNGRAILIDFGVSKQYDEAAGENTSTILGRTPGYAPIEQMSHKLRAFTPATDIYALGATLYKAVTGVTPPEATELHIGEELIFPPSLSTPVVNAIEAATQMRAEDRPQTIAAFLSILDAPATAQPTPAQPKQTPTRPFTASVQPKPAPAQPKQTPTQPLSTPAPASTPTPTKSKSNKKHLILAAGVAVVIILAAALIFLLTSKTTISASSSSLADTSTVLESSIEPPDDEVGEAAPIPQEETSSQEDPENYTGLPLGSIFSYGGIKYYVTANGKIEVGYNEDISGNVNIPSKVTYNSYTYDVTSIGNKAFDECEDLTSITIPSSVTSIGNWAFNCTSITSVTIPSSVTIIGFHAFASCSSLTSVTIPSSVTYIGDGAFYNCSSLTSVTIPSSVTSIGAGAFNNCDNLSAFHGKFASSDNRCLVVHGTLNSFAPKGLTSYTIPSSVTSIGNEAFRYCSSLTSITIPSSVTYIGIDAFDSCTSLTSVTIPSSVTYIDYGAYLNCSSLTSITIPSSVTTIGCHAFLNCINLTSVKIENPNCKIDAQAFDDTPFRGKTNPADFR